MKRDRSPSFLDNSGKMTDDIQAADRLVKRIERLHSAPQVAQKVLILTRDPDFDMVAVADCLKQDPALTARILRVVNSSKHGLAQRVSNVQQAAAYLGPRSLRLLSLTFGLVETLTRGPAAGVFQDFWKRALTMASVASELAACSDDLKADDAFTGGLLAEIGILVLAQFHTRRYVPLYASNTHGPELIAAERQQFGVGHTVLGRRLLERWSVPEGLSSAVGEHHRPRPSDAALSAAIWAASLTADVLWTDGPHDVLTVKAVLDEKFGLDTDDFIDLVLGTRGRIEQNAALFGVRIKVNSAELMTRARRWFAEAALDAAFELDSLTAIMGEPERGVADGSWGRVRGPHGRWS